MMEEGIVSESKPKVRKAESDEEYGEFDCYDKSERKPVHIDIDIDKETTEGNKSTLALPPNRLEEDEINNNGETRDGDGNIYRTHSKRSTHTEIDDDGGDWIGSRPERRRRRLRKQLADGRSGMLYGVLRIFGYAIVLNQKLFLETRLCINSKQCFTVLFGLPYFFIQR